MMTMATSVMVPANPLVLTYLRLHLRRYSMLSAAEEGKFAVFCAKVRPLLHRPIVSIHWLSNWMNE